MNETEIGSNQDSDIESKMWIYKITNKVNGKSYIGKSKEPERRWEEHLNQRKRYAIHHAIDKYGVQNFSFQVIAETDKENVDSLEIQLIAENKTFITENGYNETRGGDGGEMSEDVRQRISETLKRKFASGEIPKPQKSEEGLRSLIESKLGNTWNKGRKLTDEHKQRISESLKGKKKRPRTEEEKEKQSKLLKEKYASGELVAKPCSEEHKERLRRLMTGKKRSEESKLKQSKSRKGIPTGPFSEEHKENIRKAKLGTKASEETRAKMSQMRKGRKRKIVIVECPHCGKIGDNLNLKRYHFDNCKLKPQG